MTSRGARWQNSVIRLADCAIRFFSGCLKNDFPDKPLTSQDAKWHYSVIRVAECAIRFFSACLKNDFPDKPLTSQDAKWHYSVIRVAECAIRFFSACMSHENTMNRSACQPPQAGVTWSRVGLGMLFKTRFGRGQRTFQISLSFVCVDRPQKEQLAQDSVMRNELRKVYERLCQSLV